MTPPSAHEFSRITAIGVLLCALTLAAAFAGAGVTAFAVAALVGGPISVLGGRALSRRELATAPSRPALNRARSGSESRRLAGELVDA